MTIVGDIRHSRVARSQITAYAALGAEVTLVAPATLLPPSLEGWPVAAVSHDLDSVLADDRRDLAAAAAGRAGERRLRAHHPRVLGRVRADRPPGPAAAARSASSSTPGPWSGGWRSPPRWPSSRRPAITDQVGNGVAVRMAVLFLLLGQGTREAERA